MAISDTIQSMSTNISNAYTKIADKGGTIPANKNLQNLANAIDSISGYSVESVDNGNNTQTLVINGSSSGGGGTARPADWLPIPTMSGTTDDIYILNGVVNNGMNMLYFKVSGTGTIDWGDGSATETFTNASKRTFSHHFNYSDLNSNTWTEHNKSRQALVHISGTRGNITYFSTADIAYQYTNADGNTVDYNSAISTDVYQISANVSSCEVWCGSSAGNKHRKLEIFDWKGTITNTNMNYMFRYCYSLHTILQLDTSNVTNMSYMFASCQALRAIPQLNTSKVTNMSYMFSYCYALQAIPKLDTRSVTNMSYMFLSCYALQTIPQLDTSSVTTMSNMFNNCSSLQTIPQLDVRSITTMGSMVLSCYALQTFKPYNLNSTYTSSISLTNLANSTMLTNQAILDIFNAVPANPSGTRTIQLGSTLTGRLGSTYVKNSGQYYTAIMPTKDTSIQAGKTYYTYDQNTDTYTQVTPDFTSNTFYYEGVTATWKKYVICASTDTGATKILTWIANKGYTIS